MYLLEVTAMEREIYRLPAVIELGTFAERTADIEFRGNEITWFWSDFDW